MDNDFYENEFEKEKSPKQKDHHHDKNDSKVHFSDH